MTGFFSFFLSLGLRKQTVINRTTSILRVEEIAQCLEPTHKLLFSCSLGFKTYAQVVIRHCWSETINRKDRATGTRPKGIHGTNERRL